MPITLMKMHFCPKNLSFQLAYDCVYSGQCNRLSLREVRTSQWAKPENLENSEEQNGSVF